MANAAINTITLALSACNQYHSMTHLAIKIPVIESERGWGSKIDDYMVCLSNEDAKNFCKEFNAENTEKSTPDWYMRADFEPKPHDLNQAQFDALNKSEKQRMWLSMLKDIKE